MRENLRQYRLGCLPQWVVTSHEGEQVYIDVPIGRVPLLHGDWIRYDAEWRPLGVIRKSVMESMQ